MRKRLLPYILTLGLLALLAVQALPPTTAPNVFAQPELHERLGPGERGVERVYNVTLITGDLVTVVETSDGRRSYSVLPAEPEKLNQGFWSFTFRNNTYIVPSDVDLGKLDIELFNVDYLIDEGYYNMSAYPLIIEYEKGAERPVLGVIGEHGGEVKGRFPSISSVSAHVRKDVPRERMREAFEDLMRTRGLKKVWLDRKVHVGLADSVPLIGAPDVWNLGYNGSGIQIAILDTGIDDTHPSLDDLDDNPNTTDPKVIVKKSFVEYPDPEPDDYFGHGTHCAGIAAGTGGGTPNRGVAPGAYLWNVKVLNAWGWGYWSWIISGIEFAAYGPDGEPGTGDEADIISMSLGGGPGDGTDPVSQAVDAAVDAGVVVVVAAGNEAEYTWITTPGAARKAITVGASDKSDYLAWFSSRGPTLDYRVKPDVLAPGVDINSSVPWGWEAWSGTSMATPHVAGAAALIKQALGWGPNEIKDSLISTALDLGYNVYEQGGGRIDVFRAVTTPILIDPATVSFGVYWTDTTDSANLTFYNLDAVQRNLSLSVSVSDVISGSDASSAASLNTTELYIPPGGKKVVELTINTTVEKSVYSGKLIATDMNTGEAWHAIFGFARLNRVNVTKIDRGEEAWNYIEMVKYNPSGDTDFEINDRWDWVYGNGSVTFFVNDGNYYIVSSGMYRGAPAWTIGDNITVSGNLDVTLDEGDTVPVTFDPNKPEQVMSQKDSSLHLKIKNVSWEHQYPSWWYLGWYPLNADTYISQTTMNVTFGYSYYPRRDFKPSHPELVDTSEWHKLHYAELGVSGPIDYAANYSELVRKQTTYRVAQTPKVGVGYVQWAWTREFVQVTASTFSYRLTAPQERTEFLSPRTDYDMDIWKRDDRPGIQTPYWEYWGWVYSGDPGGTLTDPWNIHPLHMPLYAWWYSWEEGGVTHYDVRIYSEPEDAGWHDFWSDWEDQNTMLVYRNGTLILNETYPWYWYHAWLSDQPAPSEYLVIMDCYTHQYLSAWIHTEAKFYFNPSITGDMEPPRVRPYFLPEPDMNNEVRAGNVSLVLDAWDSDGIDSVEAWYSTDGGATWNPISLSAQPDGTYIGDLGSLEDVYVSIKFNATDVHGNWIEQEILDGIYVSPEVMYTLADFPAPFITDGESNGMMVIGSSDPRGPVNPSHTIDVAAAVALSHALGKRTDVGSPDVFLDWQVANYNDTHVTRIFRPGNLITFGGLGVNLISWYYHYLTYHGQQVLAAYMASDDQGMFIYSTATGNKYRMTNDYGQGLQVTDYAMIVLHYDPVDRRYVLLIAGLSGYSTSAAANWLGSYPEMSGRALILKLTDNEGDGIIDAIQIQEIIP